MSIRAVPLVLLAGLAINLPASATAQRATGVASAPPLPAVASGAVIIVDASALQKEMGDFGPNAVALRLRAEARLRDAGIPVAEGGRAIGIRRLLRLELHARIFRYEPNVDPNVVVWIALAEPGGRSVLWRTSEDARPFTAYRFLREAVPQVLDAHIDAFVRTYRERQARG